MKKHIYSLISLILAFSTLIISTVLLTFSIPNEDAYGRECMKASKINYHLITSGDKNIGFADRNNKIHEIIVAGYGEEMALRNTSLKSKTLDYQLNLVINQTDFIFLGERYDKQKTGEIYVTDYYVDWLQEKNLSIGVGTDLFFGEKSFSVSKIINTDYKDQLSIKNDDERSSVLSSNYLYMFLASDDYETIGSTTYRREPIENLKHLVTSEQVLQLMKKNDLSVTTDLAPVIRSLKPADHVPVRLGVAVAIILVFAIVFNIFLRRKKTISYRTIGLKYLGLLALSYLIGLPIAYFSIKGFITEGSYLITMKGALAPWGSLVVLGIGLLLAGIEILVQMLKTKKKNS